MNDSDRRLIFERIARFRGELADMAFTLERRGRYDAAEVTMLIAGRLAELEGKDAPAAGKTRPGVRSAALSS